MPVGTRVRVKVYWTEGGSDALFHGRLGTVVGGSQWAQVKLDEPRQGWPNPVLLCWHNLTLHVD